MVVDASDPVTGTKWLSSSNYTGQAKRWVTAVLGFAGLILAFLIAMNTVVPPAGNVIEGVSGGLVSTSGQRKVDF